MEIAERLAFLLAGILFIIGLWWSARPERAARGNLTLALGMTLAGLTTLAHVAILTLPEIVGAVVAGTTIGGLWARSVKRGEMPAVAAILTGLSGLASMLVGLSDYWSRQMERNMLPDGVPLFADGMAILLGGAAFSGSMLAWSKLSGILKMGPGPGIGYRSGGLFLLVAGLALCGVLVPYPEYYSAALALAAVALALGVAAVAPIHKPEMQAVVLLMGAFSGFAAAGVGFAMASEVVVVGGGLVGAATLGQCLALCREKKRSLWRVLRGR